MQDTTVPTANTFHDGLVPVSRILKICDKLAKRITGMDSKKEKRAAAARVSPTASPAAMVMPEREVPGINASA